MRAAAGIRATVRPTLWLAALLKRLAADSQQQQQLLQERAQRRRQQRKRKLKQRQAQQQKQQHTQSLAEQPLGPPAKPPSSSSPTAHHPRCRYGQRPPLRWRQRRRAPTMAERYVSAGLADAVVAALSGPLCARHPHVAARLYEAVSALATCEVCSPATCPRHVAAEEPAATSFLSPLRWRLSVHRGMSPNVLQIEKG